MKDASGELICPAIVPIRARVTTEQSSIEEEGDAGTGGEGTGGEGTGNVGAEVFRGSSAACVEYGLVLDARGFGYERVETPGAWTLVVAPTVREAALEELSRYSVERSEGREHPAPFVPFEGSAIGAGVYALILIFVAYCAGIGAFGVDWLGAGAIESQAGSALQWWRPVTALTLHLDQEHLLGNLLFGVGVGTLAGRMFGPGVAWGCILLAGAVGNGLDMLVSPAGHRAVGASTAVFAALGLLAGCGWGRSVKSRDRRYYRWAPLFGGVCLLALLGAGAPDQHVDVLGHVLGFAVGTCVGWMFGRAGMPRLRDASTQWVAGAGAVLTVAAAWALALGAAR